MDDHRIERWDASDLAALVGWGPGHVVVSFRGTVSIRCGRLGFSGAAATVDDLHGCLTA